MIYVRIQIANINVCFAKNDVCIQIATSTEPPPIPDNLSPPIRDLMLRCLEQKIEERPTARDLMLHPLFTHYMSQRTVQESNL